MTHPGGDLLITLIVATTALAVPSNPSETTTVEESPHSRTTTGEADPEPASVRLVEPARLEAAPEVWGGYDRERFRIGATSTATAATPAKRVLLGDSDIEPVMRSG